MGHGEEELSSLFMAIPSQLDLGGCVVEKMLWGLLASN